MSQRISRGRPLTDEEAAELQCQVDQAEAERPDMIDRDRRRRAALQEPGVAGQLRRAIAAAGIRSPELAQRAGIPLAALSDFLAGDAPLDTDTAARLADVLRYELVPISS